MIEQVVRLLKEHGATLAVAESCTGGRIASSFTARAGASEYFPGGVVAYADDVKINVLGVERAVLERHGAVSREVAEQMAAGVKRISGSDFAVSTTGIAGPTGGSAEKPVGTVWIAAATPNGEVVSQRFQFHGSRAENIESATAAAIGMLFDAIRSADSRKATGPGFDRL